MLGQLYKPKGMALQTAQEVLEDHFPMAINMARGCTNRCKYCYGSQYDEFGNKRKGEITFPKQSPTKMAEEQWEKGIRPKAVFMSFITDPFLECNRRETELLIGFFLRNNVKVATLSKVGISIYNDKDLRTGMTIISPDETFTEMIEPHALSSFQRIESLKARRSRNGYVWVSMEPFPTPAYWKADQLKYLQTLLEALEFVDFIIFGKLNYDIRGKDRTFYMKAVRVFEEFCIEHGIRYAVKPGTLRYIGR